MAVRRVTRASAGIDDAAAKKAAAPKKVAASTTKRKAVQTVKPAPGSKPTGVTPRAATRAGTRQQKKSAAPKYQDSDSEEHSGNDSQGSSGSKIVVQEKQKAKARPIKATPAATQPAERLHWLWEPNEEYALEKEARSSWDRPFSLAAANDRWNEKMIWANEQSPHIINASWKSLEKAVETFVHSSLLTEKPHGKFSSGLRQELKRVCYDPAVYMNEPGVDGTRRLMEGHVWRLLWQHQFRQDSSEMYHSAGWTEFGPMKAAFHIDVAEKGVASHTRAYHNWRVNSARLLFALHGRQTIPTKLEETLRKELAEIIKGAGENPRIVTTSLKQVVRAAIYFSFLRDCVEEDVRIHQPIPSEPLASDAALKKYRNIEPRPEDVADRRTRRLDLIVQPGLRVYGSRRKDGVKYLGHDILRPTGDPIESYGECILEVLPQISAGRKHTGAK